MIITRKWIDDQEKLHTSCRDGCSGFEIINTDLKETLQILWDIADAGLSQRKAHILGPNDCACEVCRAVCKLQAHGKS